MGYFHPFEEYALKFRILFILRCPSFLSKSANLKGQYHEDFARVWPHWKANSHINIYENLKILVIFLFRHHTNSAKLLPSVFGHGWPRCKWITTWKRPANVFKFCACILQKSLKTYKGIMVCSPCKNSLDIFLLVFQEHFVCEWRHLISISAKFWRNARKIPVQLPL